MRSLSIAIVALIAALLPPAGGAFAEELAICYNYGCNSRGRVDFGDAHLAELRALLAEAADARAERARIAFAIGRMYSIAGEQTPVWRDKGGNLNDGGENGQMDCIDHSTNTTAFLKLLQRHGALRFHEVLEPAKRARFFVFAEHWAAQIREQGAKQTHVVDSWYFDNGLPALVLSTEVWRKGRIQNVPAPAAVASSSASLPPKGD